MIAFVVGGFILLAAEVAILPGFGIAGIGAIVCFASAAIYAWHLWGFFWGAIASLGVATGVGIVLWLLPRTKLAKNIVLHRSVDGTATAKEKIFLGKTGVTLTPLRPAGMVQIEDQRVDVVTDGGFIEANIEVVVIAVDGPRVVVEAIKEEATG